jgi:hypothetical protein
MANSPSPLPLSSSLAGEGEKHEPGYAFLLAGLLLVTSVALALRIALINYSTWDVTGIFLPWLDGIRSEGSGQRSRGGSPRTNTRHFTGTLSPLADTVLPSGTDGQTVIKSVSIFFDFAAAATVFAVALAQMRARRRALSESHFSGECP